MAGFLTSSTRRPTLVIYILMPRHCVLRRRFSFLQIPCAVLAPKLAHSRLFYQQSSLLSRIFFSNSLSDQLLVTILRLTPSLSGGNHLIRRSTIAQIWILALVSFAILMFSALSVKTHIGGTVLITINGFVDHDFVGSICDHWSRVNKK